MMKILSVALLFTCSPLFAKQLTSFEAITQEIDQGKKIVVVVHDKLCKMNDPNERKIPESTMVIKPSVMAFTEKFISFSAEKFAVGPYPFFPNGVLQRVYFNINNSGQLNVIIAFFDSETNQKSPKWLDVKIQCQLDDNGFTVYDGV